MWNGLNKDVSKWSRECIDCRTSRIHLHTRAPVASFAVPVKRFSHIHVDIVGPLPPSSGYTHLLTIIDRSTRWPEAIPLTTTSTSECAKAIISSWISRFGVPSDMTSDRGAQFTSALWSDMAQQLGIAIHHTTAYHPAANGLVERFHRSLKDSLKSRLRGPSWIDELPWVLLGIRTTPKEDLRASSAELVYGETLTVPGDFIPTQTTPTTAAEHLSKSRSFVKSFVAQPTTQHGHTAIYMPKTLETADYVFIRRDGHRGPLQRPYHGPYKVIAPGEKTFLVDMGGKEERISVDRLKPAYVDTTSDVRVAQPPRRGRPPARRTEPLPCQRESSPSSSPAVRTSRA